MSVSLSKTIGSDSLKDIARVVSSLSPTSVPLNDASGEGSLQIHLPQGQVWKFWGNRAFLEIELTPCGWLAGPTCTCPAPLSIWMEDSSTVPPSLTLFLQIRSLSWTLDLYKKPLLNRQNKFRSSWLDTLLKANRIYNSSQVGPLVLSTQTLWKAGVWRS